MIRPFFHAHGILESHGGENTNWETKEESLLENEDNSIQTNKHLAEGASLNKSQPLENGKEASLKGNLSEENMDQSDSKS